MNMNFDSHNRLYILQNGTFLEFKNKSETRFYAEEENFLYLRKDVMSIQQILPCVSSDLFQEPGKITEKEWTRSETNQSLHVLDAPLHMNISQSPINCYGIQSHHQTNTIEAVTSLFR